MSTALSMMLTVLKRWRATFLIFLLPLLPSRPGQAKEQAFVPSFKLAIRSVTFERPVFSIKGSLTACSSKKVVFALPAGSTYTFTRNGSIVDVTASQGIDWNCGGPDPIIRFEGESPAVKRCAASQNEIYCLNNSAPNPEIIADLSRYDLSFELPEGYGALTTSLPRFP